MASDARADLSIVSTKDAPAAIGPYSQAVIAGKLLYTAGQIPLDANSMDVDGTDIETQSERLADTLAEAVLVSLQRLYMGDDDTATTGVLRLGDLRAYLASHS